MAFTSPGHRTLEDDDVQRSTKRFMKWVVENRDYVMSFRQRAFKGGERWSKHHISWKMIAGWSSLSGIQSLFGSDIINVGVSLDDGEIHHGVFIISLGIVTRPELLNP
jgi:hypothetical protein